MVVRSSSSTPVPYDENHPIHKLTIGTQEQIHNLAKQHPILLLNQVTENGFQNPDLESLRCQYNYIYVINWLYNYRGYLKLQSELFDVDLFELELLGFFPRDDNYERASVLFINKLKLPLISIAKGSKITDVNNFENVFREIFGIETPLGGKLKPTPQKQEQQSNTEPEVEVIDVDSNDDEAEAEAEEEEEEDLPQFDYLKIEEKFEILYILLNYISKYSKFRNWIDHQGLSLDQLRMDPIFQPASETHIEDDYFTLFDDNRLYKRTTTYNSFIVPKKRKDSPENPQDFYKPEVFDVKNVKFELIYKNIYEFNEYLTTIRKKPTFKPLYNKLSSKLIVESIFDNEIKKRKFLTARRKEIQMVNLLAVRKRSSRLEQKEQRRREEMKLRKEQEIKEAAERRFERRLKVRSNGGNTAKFDTTGLSRDERMKLRKLNNGIATDSTTASPSVTATTTKSPTPVSHTVSPTPEYDASHEVIELSSDDKQDEELQPPAEPEAEPAVEPAAEPESNPEQVGEAVVNNENKDGDDDGDDEIQIISETKNE